MWLLNLGKLQTVDLLKVQVKTVYVPFMYLLLFFQYIFSLLREDFFNDHLLRIRNMNTILKYLSPVLSNQSADFKENISAMDEKKLNCVNMNIIILHFLFALCQLHYSAVSPVLLTF